MNRTCPCSGCQGAVSPGQLMCRRCWPKVPKPLQRRVWRLHRARSKEVPGAAEEHLAACREAIRAVRAA